MPSARRSSTVATKASSCSSRSLPSAVYRLSASWQTPERQARLGERAAANMAGNRSSCSIASTASCRPKAVLTHTAKHMSDASYRNVLEWRPVLLETVCTGHTASAQ